MTLSTYRIYEIMVTAHKKSKPHVTEAALSIHRLE